jgi:hypothetical protein
MSKDTFVLASLILWSTYLLFLIGVFIDYSFNDSAVMESIEEFFIKIFRRNKKDK